MGRGVDAGLSLHMGQGRALSHLLSSPELCPYLAAQANFPKEKRD